MPSHRRGAFVNVTHFDPGAWEAQLAGVDALGVEHVELWLEFDPDRSQLAAMRRLFEGRTTIMHGPFMGLSFASEWDALAELSVERSLRALDVAGELGCEVVTFHAGIHGFFSSHDAALERVARRYARLADAGGPAPAIENLPRRSGATREAAGSLEDLEALAAIEPRVRFTLDVGHCVQNGEDPTGFVERHRDRIRDVHLHDARTGGEGHLRLGSADLRLDLVLGALERSGYSGFLTLETVGAEDTAASWRVLQAASSSR